jgi:hypothetical protein
MQDMQESRIRALEQTVVGLRRKLSLLQGIAMGVVVVAAGAVLLSAARERAVQDLIEAREIRIIGPGEKVTSMLTSGEHGGAIRVFGPEREALRLEAAREGGAVSVYGTSGARAAQMFSKEGRGACQLYDAEEKLRLAQRVTDKSAEVVLFDAAERCQLRLGADETTGRIDVFGPADPKPQVVLDTTSSGPRVMTFGGSIAVVDATDGKLLSALGRDEHGGELTVRSILGHEQARLASDPRGGVLTLQNRLGKRSRVLHQD